ncbi:MAG: hypothetical protein IMZ53_13455 [Thermoplasmata archaeon]|nr:hypothetical protein [Thermoplasmata archaeon]MBE3141576.1 hypothetical protein [Thermoplasmata archaeon]
MAIDEKNHGKLKKTLNKNDPFDQLIMALTQKGVLDVCAVGIGQESSVPEKRHEYSRKPDPIKGSIPRNDLLTFKLSKDV